MRKKLLIFFLSVFLICFLLLYYISILDERRERAYLVEQQLPICGLEWWKKATPDVVQRVLEDKQKHQDKCRASSTDVDILLDAASSAKPESLKVLLENGFDKVINESVHGWTALHTAIQYQAEENVVEMIHLLHKYGANLNIAPYGSVLDSSLPPGPGHSIWSPVVHSRHKTPVKLRIINTLLELGADPRTPSPGNSSIGLGLVLQISTWPIVKEVLSGVKNFKWSEICGLPDNRRTRLTTCAHYAMGNYNSKVAQEAIAGLQAEGVTIKRLPRGARGETLLYYAVRFGHPWTIKYLIKSGLDINAQISTGRDLRSILHSRIAYEPDLSNDKELIELVD